MSRQRKTDLAASVLRASGWLGAELLWGEREEFGCATGDVVRLQISFKYSFAASL